MAQWNASTVPKCEKSQWSDEVLVTVEKGRYYTVFKAIYIPYHHVTTEDSGWCMEDGIPDDWWIPEGWYEVCDNCRDATYFPINGRVTAWMKLPRHYEPRIKQFGNEVK